MLVVAVVAVWGFVARKIFFANPAMPEVTIPRPTPGETRKAEEYSLRLDYEDPFLKDVTAVASKPSIPTQYFQPVDPPHMKPPLPPEDLPLKYAGTISAGGRISHLFDCAGILHVLSPGESLEGYTFAQAFRDSVRISKDGLAFTIHIQR